MKTHAHHGRIIRKSIALKLLFRIPIACYNSRVDFPISKQLKPQTRQKCNELIHNEYNTI